MSVEIVISFKRSRGAASSRVLPVPQSTQLGTNYCNIENNTLPSR